MKLIKNLQWVEFLIPLLQNIYEIIPEGIREQPLMKNVEEHILDERLYKDVLFRTRVLLYPGFVANLLYAAMQFVLGIFYHSIWSGALAVYYALLAVMRVQLIKPVEHQTEGKNILYELRQYRLCGIILLCMTPLFAIIMILVVHKNVGTQYPGFAIVIMGIYAVCLVVSSISNLVKFRRYKRPAMSAAKIICLIASLMSVLSLATALVGKLGDRGSDYFKQGLVGTVGGAVCVIVLSIAIYMVVHAKKQFNLIQSGTRYADSVSNSLNKSQI